VKHTKNNSGNLKSHSSGARPFVKWAGGKRKLLELYQPFFPPIFKHYFEPFVGGGAVLFGLLERYPSMRATIMDTNAELMNAYRVVKTEVETLSELLAQHKQYHSKEFYYKVRAWDQDVDGFAKLSDAQRAARLIYLNKTCFNGLYRVNSHGFYNVPFGRYKAPPIHDPENLRNVSRILQNVEITTSSFECILELAQKGDFIYFDPPYQPLSSTANFTSYTSNNFDEHSQQKLRDVFKTLDQRGCFVALSNSTNNFIQKLYLDMEGIKIKEVLAPRAINRDINKRGKIPEILILGRTLALQKP
jgi:DNA adenine methylase